MEQVLINPKATEKQIKNFGKLEKKVQSMQKNWNENSKLSFETTPKFH